MLGATVGHHATGDMQSCTKAFPEDHLGHAGIGAKSPGFSTADPSSRACIGWNPAGSVSAGVTVGAGVGGILAIGGVQIGNQNSNESTTTETTANDPQGSNRSVYGGDDGNTTSDGTAINGLI